MIVYSRQLLLIAFFIQCYSPLLSRLTVLACDSTWVTSFYSAFFLKIHQSGVLTVLTWLVPYETAAASARSVYTIEPCTMSLHAKPHNKMHACLAATCRVHFWQNVLNPLYATAVTWGWNGYCCSCRDIHESGTLTTELSPLPSSTCNKACLSKIINCKNKTKQKTPN